MVPNLTRAAETARHLLLRQNPPRLPIKADRLSFGRAIVIDSMKRFCMVTATTLDELACGTDCLKDGCTLVLSGGRFVILYNEESRSHRRRNFTLAHELGHIFLGHAQDGDLEEQEANCFAAELIVPRILAASFLAQLPDGRDPVASLSDAFFASAAMARVRLRTMQENLPFSPQEKELQSRYAALLPRLKEPIVTY